MQLDSLTAISPIDGRYHQRTKELQNIFSEYALIKWRFVVEIKWLIALSHSQHIDEIRPFTDEEQTFLTQFIANFDEHMAAKIKNIEKTTNHDVKAVEYFIKEHISAHPSLAPYSEFVHFSCTSEDINNLSYALMMQEARETILIPSFSKLIEKFRHLSHQYATTPMLARTHGQPATPTTIGKEFANVFMRLERQMLSLKSIRILGKLNGAVGNYNAHMVSYPEMDWETLSATFIESLGLHHNAYTTQIEPHDWIAEYCHTVLRINTVLIDCCRDIWGYISLEYFHQKKLSHEIGSSTMPHKVNPIDFENAEGNFGFANAMLNYFATQLPVSRWQRDLTDSTLLRNLGVAIAHTLIAIKSLEVGLNKLVVNEQKLIADLDQCWEILAEPIQTVMRRYGIADAYEQLKNLTRGEKLTPAQLQQFINALAIPDQAKQNLLKLTPKDYVGKAADLAKRV